MKHFKIFVVPAVLLLAVFAFLPLTAKAIEGGVNCLAYRTSKEKVTCLTGLINTLLAQIKLLQASHPQTSSPTSFIASAGSQTKCHSFVKSLGYSNSGSTEVGQLHVVLQKEGISFSPDSGNNYSIGTYNAVVRLQKKYGITQTGYLGPQTRAKINELYGCGSSLKTAAKTVAIPLSKEATGQRPMALTYPTAGTSWQFGKTYTVLWNWDPEVAEQEEITYVNITLFSNQAGYSKEFTEDILGSEGKFEITLDDEKLKAGAYNIRIRAKDRATQVFSDSFQIRTHFIEVTKPASGDKWEKGIGKAIEWNAMEVPLDVVIDAVKTTGGQYRIAETAAADCAYFWEVGYDHNGNEMENGSYKIKITDAEDSSVVGTGEVFEVTAASTTNPTTTHFACQSNQCVSVAGAGTNECSEIGTFCGTTEPTEPSGEGITFVSPAEGETWKLGEVKTLKFIITNDIQSINVYLMPCEGGACSHESTGARTIKSTLYNPGFTTSRGVGSTEVSYNWLVGNVSPTVPAGSYKIVVSYWAGEVTAYALGGLFSISSASTTSVTHLACQSNQCISVSGAGANQCSTHADCAPTMPSGSTPTINLKANNQESLSLTQNTSMTFSWTSTNSSSCSTTGGYGGWAQSARAISGQAVVNSQSSATFTITCVSSTGVSASDSVVITVVPPSASAGGVEGVGLFDPITAHFYLKNANATGFADSVFAFGEAGANWKPIAGDWNGDGTDTIGLYVPSISKFYLRNTNAIGVSDSDFTFGSAGWLPVAGDWNGDGTDTVGLYNPSTATFYLKNSNSAGTADIIFGYGTAGTSWLPIAGDWNGDGTDTVGLYDPSTSSFHLKDSNSAGAAEIMFAFGTGGQGLKPLAGDWDNNGVDTVGFYNPSTSGFSLKNSNTTGFADLNFSLGTAGSGWLPISGYWNATSAPASQQVAMTLTANGSAGPNVSVAAGTIVTFAWTSTNADSCSYASSFLPNSPFALSQTSGTITFQPQNSVTYTFTCSNSSSQATKSISLGVSAASPVTCQTFTYGFWNVCENGIQTRTAAGNVEGCVGGNPITTQPCIKDSVLGIKMGQGAADWLPVIGDWNMDKVDSVGVYDSPSQFYLSNKLFSSSADISFAYGESAAGWMPIAGDWNGDGTKTIGLYNPINSSFYLRNSNTTGYSDINFAFGTPNGGYRPVAGDWDGDGTTTIGLYKLSTSEFYLRNSNSTGVADISFAFGDPNDWPIAGDWDNDNKTEIGVYHPGVSYFYLKNENSPGAPTATFPFGTPGPGWKPVAGDWNSDGISTVGLYNPATSTFYLKNENREGIAQSGNTSFIASLNDIINNLLAEIKAMIAK